jgi:hypothetical protein
MDAAQESHHAPEPPVMDVLTGLHVQACGHYMHFGCCKRYMDSLRQSSLLSAPFEGMNLLCLDAGEFLCPICRRLANTLLPVGSSVQTPSCPPPSPPQLPSDVLSRALAALPLPAPPPPALGNSPSRDVCVEDFLARAWVMLTERSVWSTQQGGLSVLLQVFPRSNDSASQPLSLRSLLWTMLAHNVSHLETVLRAGGRKVHLAPHWRCAP